MHIPNIERLQAGHRQAGGNFALDESLAVSVRHQEQGKFPRGRSCSGGDASNDRDDDLSAAFAVEHRAVLVWHLDASHPALFRVVATSGEDRKNRGRSGYECAKKARGIEGRGRRRPLGQQNACFGGRPPRYPIPRSAPADHHDGRDRVRTPARVRNASINMPDLGPRPAGEPRQGSG